MDQSYGRAAALKKCDFWDETKALNIFLKAFEDMDFKGLYKAPLWTSFRNAFSEVYSFEPSIYEVWQDLHEFYYGCVLWLVKSFPFAVEVIYGSFIQSTTQLGCSGLKVLKCED